MRKCICDRGIPASGPVPAWDKTKMCNKCFLFATNKEYNRNRGGDGNVRLIAPVVVRTVSTPLPTYPCTRRNDKDRSLGNATCAEGCAAGRDKFPIRPCSLHGKCVVAKTVQEPGIKCCRDCNDRIDPATVPVKRIDSLPPSRRIPIKLEGHFNGGMEEFKGRIFLTSRFNEQIHLSILTDDFKFIVQYKNNPLTLNHPLCSAGCEDGRLIVHQDQLHLGFTGISHVNRGKKRSDQRITQLLARLDKDFNAVEITTPSFSVQPVEKNWGWFSFDNDLYVVYSISPHVVIRVRDGQRFETPNFLPWSGGYLRGGSPPRRVGDKYVSWIHGAEDTPTGRIYNVGVYEFEATPPFKIVRQSPTPLLWGDPATRPEPRPSEAEAVVFPMGAILRKGKWFVSCGIHDSSIEILEWDAAEVEKFL